MNSSCCTKYRKLSWKLPYDAVYVGLTGASTPSGLMALSTDATVAGPQNPRLTWASRCIESCQNDDVWDAVRSSWVPAVEFRGTRPGGTGSAEARREDGERRRGAMRRNSRQGAEAVLWVEMVGIMERV